MQTLGTGGSTVSFEISYRNDGRMQLAIESNGVLYALAIESERLRNPFGRELVSAWAVAVATIPGSKIEFTAVDELLDYLDQTFPVKTTLRRPRWTIW
jgi:hypothetical protein